MLDPLLEAVLGLKTFPFAQESGSRNLRANALNNVSPSDGSIEEVPVAALNSLVVDMKPNIR